MRRIAVVVLATLSSLTLSSAPAVAGELEDAEARQRAVQAELDAATRAFVESRDGLEDAQAELAKAERRAAQLEGQATGVRAALDRQARTLYQTGGLEMASSVLDAGPAGLAQRIELTNLVETQRAIQLEEARRVIDGHAVALAEAARARDARRTLTAKQAAAVERLGTSFAEAERLTTRIETRQAAARAAAAREQARREAAARATTTSGPPSTTPSTSPPADDPPRSTDPPATTARPLRAKPPVQAKPPVTDSPVTDPPPVTTGPPATTRPPITTRPVLKPDPAPRLGVACPVASPRSYIDSWGAARSGGRRHKGTDIMATYGTRVLAYVSGRISQARAAGGLGGNVIYLQGDNGEELYYAHLQSFDVSSGQRVDAGQLIARTGATGNAPKNAPHVHFEVHPGGGAAVNPYPRVKAACG